jgi:hypothetical protein
MPYANTPTFRLIEKWVLWPIQRGLRDFKWYLLHRLAPKHRYHLVNTGLEPGYYEIDTRMLYANFQLLVAFVEREMGLTDWSDNAESKNYKKQIMKLYHWWTKERFVDEKRENALLRKLPKVKFVKKSAKDSFFTCVFDGSPEAKKAHRDYDTFKEKMDRKETENLVELIKIRHVLWS